MEKLEEEQMLQTQKREKELEFEKLRMAKELLDARMDIKRAELEAQLETESESDPESEIFPGLPRQSPQDGVDNSLKSYQPLPRAGAVPTPSLQPPPPKAPSTLNDEAATGNKTRENFVATHDNNQPNYPALQQILERQQDAMEQHQETINVMAMGLQQLGMPKQEFLHFDGDPIKYPRFIKNFEVNVERRIQDQTVRLSYLIQYCTGVAQEAVANCIILPPKQG